MRKVLFCSTLVLAFGTATVLAAPLGAVTRGGQTTTVSEETTTTTPQEPTTTLAPTTTVAAPTTTAPSTITTVAPVPVPANDDSNTPWGLILAILGVIAVALIVALVLMKRGANRTKHDWQGSAASALRDAELTRDMLEGEARPDQAEDPARFAAVRDKVNTVANRFDRLAANAPDDGARRSSAGIAESLRGYFFALEAERLLHDAPTPPSADQLATADATRRGRAADLDAAIAQLRSAVTPT
jgi:hypothetical protein